MSDTSDTLLIKANIRERFLAAYAEIRTVAGACRQAQVHRSSVYRWRADRAFVVQMDAAWEAGYQKWRREVYEPQERARQAAKERRNAELRAERQEQAEAMRVAKARNWLVG